MRSRLLALASAALLAIATGFAHAEPVEDRDYERVNPPQPVERKDRIEVVELFWYGCPHCYALEPVLAKWLTALPRDVVFRRVHGDFGRWAQSARLFYALEAIGEEARLRKDLFDAIHIDRLYHTKEEDITEWLEKKGVDKQKFLAAYNSAAVQAQVQRAQQLTKDYGIDGVPSIVVAGKYRTSSSLAGGHEALPAVIDALIARARSEAKKN